MEKRDESSMRDFQWICISYDSSGDYNVSLYSNIDNNINEGNHVDVAYHPIFYNADNIIKYFLVFLPFILYAVLT